MIDNRSRAYILGYWACANNLNWQDVLLHPVFASRLVEENRVEFEAGWRDRRKEDTADRAKKLFEFLVTTNNW